MDEQYEYIDNVKNTWTNNKNAQTTIIIHRQRQEYIDNNKNTQTTSRIHRQQ